MDEQEGFCGEQGEEDALSAQCRPYLKAAFRAKGDWCADHAVPQSQCVACNPALEERITGGHGAALADDGVAPADACEHGISESTCPFCTPALIESEGTCAEHGVAEALCVKCRPQLETAFKAAGDWCAEHATPESQCAICNPELMKEGGAG
jgi:cobalt-zinc-cadmium efflux system membrane fusion protein